MTNETDEKTKATINESLPLESEIEFEIAELEKIFETSHSDEDQQKYDQLNKQLKEKMTEWEELVEGME